MTRFNGAALSEARKLRALPVSSASSRASMGPRFRKRGNEAEFLCTNGGRARASMGPRFRKRGN